MKRNLNKAFLHYWAKIEEKPCSTFVQPITQDHFQNPKPGPLIKKSILHTLKLQGRTVETFEWAEEAKSRDVRNKDPRYQRLLKARALDPLSQKKLSSVQSKFMYLEQQMDEVNTKLDMEWDAHLEKCKVV